MSPIIGKMPMPRTRLRDLRLSTRGHGSVYGSPILEPLKMSHAFPVILFYKYVSVSDPASFAAEQRNLCTSIGLKGRILIAEEGINGTLAGSAESIDSYVAALKKDPRFADIEFKVSGGDAGTFPKLVVKVRPEIVALNAGEIRPDQDNQLSPADWRRMMEENPDAVLLDVRNRFESEAGRFENAVVCDIGHFRELPDYVSQLGHLKEKTVLMYCTGGIRCEKASALFRARGFKKVYQLHGGIVTYQEQFGNEHWQGECFVFDQRMTVKIEEGLVPIGRCAHTSRPTTRFVNCLHDPCHQLFLLSEEAEQENKDFLVCPECFASGLGYATAVYVRPNTAGRSAT